ncbi:MAG: hypothetical protein ACP5E6_07235, partial [Acidiphilium sp.]
MTDTPPPALSHRIDLARHPDLRRAPAARAAIAPITITAQPAQCADIAAAFGLPGIATLTGVFKLRRQHDGLIHAQLDLESRLTQICVVTLDPFEQTIRERAMLILLTAPQAAARAGIGAIAPRAGIGAIHADAGDGAID